MQEMGKLLMKKRLKNFGELCRKHIASSLIATAVISWFVSWGLNWIIPSPSVEVNNFPQKELTCTLNSGFPLFLQVTEDDDFQILFKNEEVREPWIYNITIKNTGGQPILDEDFTKPLTIEFEDSTSVIKTSIIESSNQDLWDDFLESCSIHEKNLSIDGMLLNQGESITINVVTEGAAGNIKYDQRIVGLSNLILKNSVKESMDKQEELKYMLLILSGVVIFVSIVILIYVRVKAKKEYLELQKCLSEYTKRLEGLSMEETKNDSECPCK